MASEPKNPKPQRAARKQAPSDPTMRLDASGAGGPVLLPLRVELPSLSSASAPAAGSEDLIVEIELVSGTEGLLAAWSARSPLNTEEAANAAGIPGLGLATVLRAYGLIEARPVYGQDAVDTDRRESESLRALSITSIEREAGTAAREQLPSLGQFIRMRFPAGTPSNAVVRDLLAAPEVAKAVEVPRAAPPQGVMLPSDPLIGPSNGALQVNAQGIESQWYLHRTKVPQAWPYARGRDVVVADIDWGCRTSHSDLKSGIEQTFNVVSGQADVTKGTEVGHGTGVLGIAGARSNARGITGYAPEAALWVVQADSAVGVTPSLERSYWAEAIDYVRLSASAGRPKVIILEVQTTPGGNYEQVPSVHRAVRAAIASGCVVCVAAGNGDRPADRSDAGEPFGPTGSILVGATAYDPVANRRAWFSNYGAQIVVSAPGDSQHDVTCAPGGDSAYRNGFGGTSGAAPKVGGAAALMLSVNLRLSHSDVREILATTGSAIQQDPGKPVGVFLDAEAAVAEALRRRGEHNAMLGEVLFQSANTGQINDPRRPDQASSEVR